MRKNSAIIKETDWVLLSRNISIYR